MAKSCLGVRRGAVQIMFLNVQYFWSKERRESVCLSKNGRLMCFLEGSKKQDLCLTSL
jgi:hypothetical protein